jgi:hypothetical protein
MPPAPPIELLASGALTVEAAQEFSGLSRTELFALMDAKKVRWFKPRKARLIVKSSLVAHLASLYAADPEPEERRETPTTKAKR